MLNPIYPPIIPIKSAKITSNGIMNVVAQNTRNNQYLKGLIAATSIASICSVTFMEPNSAPIPSHFTGAN
jgi:hypothetical protein